jgi:hypothetical protein
MGEAERTPQRATCEDIVAQQAPVYVTAGASYDPALPANLSWGQIAADLVTPSSPVGQAIDATANRITAAICTMTGNKPGDVCTSTGVTSASGSI